MTESYKFRPSADPHKHQVYSSLLSTSGLTSTHFSDLINRGLNNEQIHIGQYATKPPNNSKDATHVLGVLEKNHNLDDVPGFFIDDKTGNRSQSGVCGMAIPVIDYNGRINSIIIRRDNVKKDKNGKEKSKYIAFSSNGKTKGAKVWQTTHCPIIKGKTAKESSGTEVRITEGPLKADITTALGNLYCFGMHGLNPSNDLLNLLEELEISILVVCLDAGEDENLDILRCKKKLFDLANELEIDIYFETWDPKYGKGIDDVLKNGHADKITRLSSKEVEELAQKAESINPRHEDWIYVIGIERFINKRNFQILKKSQFADKFFLEDTKTVNEMLAIGYPRVDALTFLPKGGEIVVEDGMEKLNEWRDPKIDPTEGDISLFTQHIELLLPNERDRNILLDWLAFNIQHPGKKIMWALVVIGEEGIGKSFFGFVLSSCLGADNISFPTNEQIQDKYTDWQKSCQLVIIEELMTLGRKDLVNKLKPIITQLMTKIRDMYTAPYDYPNRFNILAFTNHDDALLIGEGDRRYGVVKSEMDPQDVAYYNTLWDWVKKPESAQALLYYFLDRDISHFTPHARAPSTEAKRFMAKVSRSPLEDWVCECIEDNCWPFNRQIISIRHLKAQGVCPPHLHKYSDQKWAKALQKAGSLRYEKQIPLSDNSRVKVWLIGDRRNILVNLQPSELAAQYEKEEREAESKKVDAVNPVEDDMPM